MSNIVVQPVQNQAIIRATEIAERLDLPLVTPVSYTHLTLPTSDLV